MGLLLVPASRLNLRKSTETPVNLKLTRLCLHNNLASNILNR